MRSLKQYTDAGIPIRYEEVTHFIRITQGEYTGRILTRYDLSADGRRVQWNQEEFKMGMDCEWAKMEGANK